VAVGAQAVADRARAAAAASAQALDAIDEPDLAEALTADKPSVRALYDAIKGVTDVLKTDIVTVLDLEIPKRFEGDND
jgi:uncharacterized protein